MVKRNQGFSGAQPDDFIGFVLAHNGEALQTRKQFEHLSDYDQNSVIEFLKTLQVLPPGTPSLIVDENYREKRWPPAGSD